MRSVAFGIACVFLVAGAVAAESAAVRGPVTNLPLPRFVTLKAGEANVRRGPSLTHRIDWVFTAKGMPLDPNQHQAMMEIPTEDAEPGTIVQEMQAGYMIKDRLLRPAMVGVAKKPD